jgi:hypothetical protein
LPFGVLVWLISTHSLCFMVKEALSMIWCSLDLIWCSCSKTD